MPSFLGTTDWIRVPFLNHSKTGIEYFIDQLLRLSQVEVYGHDLFEDKKVHLENLHDIREHHSTWWAKNGMKCLQPTTQDSSQPPVLDATSFKKILGVLCCLVLLVTNSKLSCIDPSYRDLDRETPDEHTAYILTSSCHLSNKIPVSIQLHALFAIHLVVLYTSSTVQREEALSVIQQYQQSHLGNVWVP